MGASEHSSGGPTVWVLVGGILLVTIAALIIAIAPLAPCPVCGGRDNEGWAQIHVQGLRVNVYCKCRPWGGKVSLLKRWMYKPDGSSE